MRTRRSSWLELLLLALPLSAGCAASHYFNRPEENATALVASKPSALFEVPSRSPHGEVRVATLGIATLAPRARDDEPTRAMHVRIIVDNHDDAAPWQIDTRQQIAIMTGRGQSRPAFATSSIGHPPVVDIDPGASAFLDLYYPLPRVMERVTYVPKLDVLWQLTTPDGPVTVRTPFEGLRAEPPAAPDVFVWDIGWWGPSYYDPLWSEETFLGAPILGAPGGDEPSLVNAAPPAPRAP